MRHALPLALVTLLLSNQASADPNPKELVERVVAEAGGVHRLKSLNDVEFAYLYHSPSKGVLSLSLERYVFEGERSWARIDALTDGGQPQATPIVQGYDGKTSWEMVNGKRATDPQARKKADFLRKTNFYWFCMTFKLLDPGIRYTTKGRKEVDGVSYELVGISYDEGVGDAQDTYVLYINPKTWRVDQFLFTVMDFGVSDPHLMKVSYERINGVLIPTKRRYALADWDGNVQKNEWTDEISTAIRFNNKFPDAMFRAP